MLNRSRSDERPLYLTAFFYSYVINTFYTVNYEADDFCFCYDNDLMYLN